MNQSQKQSQGKRNKKRNKKTHVDQQQSFKSDFASSNNNTNSSVSTQPQSDTTIENSFGSLQDTPKVVENEVPETVDVPNFESSSKAMVPNFESSSEGKPKEIDSSSSLQTVSSNLLKSVVAGDTKEFNLILKTRMKCANCQNPNMLIFVDLKEMSSFISKLLEENKILKTENEGLKSKENLLQNFMGVNHKVNSQQSFRERNPVIHDSCSTGDHSDWMDSVDMEAEDGAENKMECVLTELSGAQFPKKNESVKRMHTDKDETSKPIKHTDSKDKSDMSSNRNSRRTAYNSGEGLWSADKVEAEACSSQMETKNSYEEDNGACGGSSNYYSKRRESNGKWRENQKSDDWMELERRRHPQRQRSLDNRGGRGKRGSDDKNFNVVHEVDGDLFMASKEYSLAHCVAEDLRMGSGIAVTFRQIFKNVDTLLQQGKRSGHVAILEESGRYIYYLITKKVSNGKPTYNDLKSSLEEMKQHCTEHGVKLIAMPRIGCGLDRLEWSIVKEMLEKIFGNTGVQITVFNFQQNPNVPEPRRSRLMVCQKMMNLVSIPSDTGLVYLGTEDSFVDSTMKSLDTKYRFIQDYKRCTKNVGDVIKIERRDYLYGLIVKKVPTDPLSYEVLNKCLCKLRDMIQQDKYVYFGLEAFIADDDDLTMEKVITLLKNVFFNKELEVWICWPKDLEKIYYSYNYSATSNSSGYPYQNMKN